MTDAAPHTGEDRHEPPDILAVALAAHRAGLNLLPPRQDGSKAPDTSEWTSRQTTRSTEEEVRAWYATNGRSGVGLICGRASGGLELLDFDCRKTWEAYQALAEDAGLSYLLARVEDGYLENTPSGGVHLLYKCSSPRSGKLARRPKRPEEQHDPGDKMKTLIELKGEGGYAVVAPSCGTVHESGHPYVLVRGGFDSIVTLKEEEREALHDLARSFDEMPRTEHRETDHERPPRTNGELRPGDDFNARATWREVLEPHGWGIVFERGGEAYWRRPGKSEGLSATTDYNGSGLFYCFSTSTVFEPERGYNKFSAYALLNHGGDFAAAARHLAAHGFGQPRPGGDDAGDAVRRREVSSDGEEARPEDGAADEWERPLPLGQPAAPEFPIEALPSWQADYVKAEAEATQTPADLAGVLTLSAVAASVAGKAHVEVRAGYSEPLCIFVVAALDPANRKSQVFADTTAPIVAHEGRLVDLARGDVAAALEHIEGLREEKKKARSKGEAEQATKLAREIAKAEAAAPRSPKLVTSDVTPEALGMLLVQHRRMAVLSAEGGEVFEMARGRYAGNQRPNLEVYLKGHAGDALIVDRKRESFSIERPALTLGLAVQPSVIRSLREEDVFRGRGLLARFLYSVPESRLGARNWRNPRPVPKDIGDEYARRLTHLLSLSMIERTLKLADDALQTWIAFGEELEPRLHPDSGDLAWLSDWAGKLPGAVARIAGCLHVACWADKEDPFAIELDATTMADAVKLGRYFLGHALVAFEEMHADPALEGARKVWRFVEGYAKRTGRHEISGRDVWQGTKGGRFASAEDLDPGLALLVRRGYLALKPRDEQEPRRSGRAPSTIYRINPRAIDTSECNSGGIGGNCAE